MIPLAYLSLMQAEQVRGPYLSFGHPTDPPHIAGVHPLEGEYYLFWDDVIDGSTAHTKKVCKLILRVEGDRVYGDFDGPVEGRKREALILGYVDGGAQPVNVLTLRQLEKGYICTYQVTLGMGDFYGTWRDTNGGEGDVFLKKFKNLTYPRP